MGNNSSKWDRDAHYAAKTTKELEAIRDQFRKSLLDRKDARLTEALGHIEMLIADRIGRPRQGCRQ